MVQAGAGTGQARGKRAIRTTIKARLRKLEAVEPQGLSDADRAHILAWQARVAEFWYGGPPPTLEQQLLLARPGSWQRLQRAWARPAFARACLEALEGRQRDEIAGQD